MPKLYTCLSLCLFLFLFSIAQVQFITSGKVPNSFNNAAIAVNTALGTGTYHDFKITDPTTCNYLVEGPNNKVYGTTTFGGTNSNGVIFSMNADGSNFSLLYSANANQDINSNTTIVFGSDGKIYTIISQFLYSIDPAGGGASQIAAVPVDGYGIIADANGWLYGISVAANTYDYFAYKLKFDGSGFEILHNFNRTTEGYGFSKLCLTAQGRLFGLARSEGSAGGGTLFSFKTDRSNFTINFAFTNITGSPAAIYGDALTTTNQNPPLSVNEKIYFTNTFGGNFISGTFLSYDVMTDTLVKLRDLPGGEYSKNPILVNGKLTGSNSLGIYSMDTTGSNYTQLNTIDAITTLLYATSQSKLYMMANGGNYKNTHLLQTDVTGANKTELHQFGFIPNGYNPDGITKGLDGKFYGIALNGGAEGGGLLYKMNIDGSGYQVIHDFTGANGQLPKGQLLYGSDGRLYGICTVSGTVGSNADYLIYGINTDGSNYNILRIFIHNFDGYIVPELTESSNGVLFGAIGIVDYAPNKIFRINKDGTGYNLLKTLNPNTEGILQRQCPVWYGGYLYGIAGLGGSSNAGTIFRVKDDGTNFSLIKTFNGSDGNLLLAGLTLSADNKLYGYTWLGGTNYAGVIFTIDPADLSFKTIYNFDRNTDGASYPSGKFIQASDGRLYVAKPTGIFGINTDGTGRSFYEPNPHLNIYVNDLTISYLNEVPLTTLPIKALTNFTLNKKQSSVLLNWQTLEERNVKSFGVERSNNSISFTSIATVTAKGNTNITSNYSTEDLHPITGKNYYRLKMFDYNGKFAYSDIKTIDFAGTIKFTVYPNPAKLEIKITHGFSDGVSIIIADIGGRIVYNASSYLSSPSVNISGLKAGVYTITVKNNSNTKTGSFIKE
ncbi:MAG: choice-of-anchor tandem repeat GloVer-containing protein [Ferruginibacter sp.]